MTFLLVSAIDSLAEQSEEARKDIVVRGFTYRNIGSMRTVLTYLQSTTILLRFLDEETRKKWENRRDAH